MKNTVRAVIVGIILVTACVATSSSASAAEIWGETIGPVSAVVQDANSPKGLAVRTGPNGNAQIVGYVPKDSVVQGSSEFSQGWMKLKHPYAGAWIPVDYLVPRTAPGRVISVDQPEGCLRIRSHPSTTSKIVGCVSQNAELTLTGVWSETNWAEVKGPRPGWVYAPQISTAIHPSEPNHRTIVRRPAQVYEHPPYAEEPDEGVEEYYYPPRTYPYRPYPRRLYKRHYGRNYSPEHYYGRPGSYYGVRVRPGGRVAVDAGPVNVRVGRGVGVRVGPVGVRVGPFGGWSVNVR
jgi:hypothetical protein